MPEFLRKPWILLAVVAFMTAGAFSQHSVAGESSRIRDGSNVTLSYNITVPGEGLKVQNVGQFIQGKHELLPALEQAVAGLKTGDEKKVSLSAVEGFGAYSADKTITVPREDLPPETKEGDVLEDRAGQSATVSHLSEKSAVMDYNHPLAGKPVVVEMKILRVDNPS
ncbi:MAG TPA: FKBP-type peptidyl-prolyl cis-trans isomerase [Nitrospira sp.]|mgnify:CR=1 FL=1|nr:FKBP-type peptidyl-prolyl cis-trans isomerase [Nitrospira sp.]